MTIIGELAKALGKGRKKVFAAAVSAADGDTVDTGLSSIDTVIVCPSVNTHNAAVTGISGGTNTIGLYDIAGAAAVTTAETVYIIAVGDPK